MVVLASMGPGVQVVEGHVVLFTSCPSTVLSILLRTEIQLMKVKVGNDQKMKQ